MACCHTACRPAVIEVKTKVVPTHTVVLETSYFRAGEQYRQTREPIGHLYGTTSEMKTKVVPPVRSPSVGPQLERKSERLPQYISDRAVSSERLATNGIGLIGTQEKRLADGIRAMGREASAAAVPVRFGSGIQQQERVPPKQVTNQKGNRIITSAGQNPEAKELLSGVLDAIKQIGKGRQGGDLADRLKAPLSIREPYSSDASIPKQALQMASNGPKPTLAVAPEVPVRAEKPLFLTEPIVHGTSSASEILRHRYSTEAAEGLFKGMILEVLTEAKPSAEAVATWEMLLQSDSGMILVDAVKFDIKSLLADTPRHGRHVSPHLAADSTREDWAPAVDLHTALFSPALRGFRHLHDTRESELLAA